MPDTPWIYNVSAKHSWLGYSTERFDEDFVAVLPVVSYVKDEEQPINYQEKAVLNLINASLGDQNLRVLPLVIYSNGIDSAYDMEAEDVEGVVWDMIESVARSKCTKLLIVNASEENRHMLDVMLPDIRVELGLLPYLLHLDDIDWDREIFAQVLKEL